MTNDSESSLVYPKFVGNKIMLPHLQGQRQFFLGQLTIAAGHFHAAGVVHFDLYLSSVMWREVSPSEVIIKVIDWDAAHFLYEKQTQATQYRLNG